MDEVILNLSQGLGLQNTIGFFFPIFIGTLNVLPSLLSLFQYADKSSQYNKQRVHPFDFQIYDFIVVGGGTAGSVVAARLCSGGHRVLLLERGGDPHPLTSVPGLESLLINRPEVDYGYLTLPQNQSCLSLNNRQSLWSLGAGLGGTTTINAMVYLRGHSFDYDIWSHWTSDKRWSYKSVLPFFLKSESYCFHCDTGFVPIQRNFHSKDGEIPLRKPSELNIVPEFVEAMEWAGVPRADLNAPFTRGVDMITYTQKNGRRVTTKDAFLDPLKGNPNLQVVKYATVSKVLFQGKRAYGVEYEQFGEVLQAFVTKEVVLSAGAVASPKILMLSGIGPSKHLKELKIPVLVDSPAVGQNLQDHVGTLVGPFLINQPMSHIPERDVSLGTVRDFLNKNGSGPLSLTFPHAVAILPSSKAKFPSYPDIQIGLSAVGVSPSTLAGLSRVYNLREDLVRSFYSPLLKDRPYVDAFNLIVNYARPKSRGTIRLRSNDFKDDPIINPNYFGEPEDLDRIVEAVQIAVEIAEKGPSLGALKTKLSPIPWPSCRKTQFRSDAYYRCLARELTLTLHHFVGTVRMGKEGALDSELRVKGVDGLRVIDASIMPFITTMNTMGPTIMIGERGVQFLLDEWSPHVQKKKTRIKEVEWNLVGHDGSHQAQPSSTKQGGTATEFESEDIQAFLETHQQQQNHLLRKRQEEDNCTSFCKQPKDARLVLN